MRAENVDGCNQLAALIVPHTKNSMIGIYNFFAGINPGMQFGGPIWAVIDFNDALWMERT